eukprot:CAMPEP_0174703698 /NCGR_PEP_ID=MMETSP1094-20130205/7554_1 /TAXON_ID=156173 /ORGANISM="Chrysochromulina brevifilum, Strain UTEX LB 985" /LENGTH=36 /DNA_ID= /DNA_START= /DNA_END= /DNA_ORIENTATION=
MSHHKSVRSRSCIHHRHAAQVQVRRATLGFDSTAWV